MKFLHLGDLHLGKSLNDFDLIEDQRHILTEILDIADKESADGALIAGDVYDRPVPSEAATRLLNSFLNELAKRGIKVFMVSGNHDSDERLNYGSGLFSSSRIFISAVFDGKLRVENVSDGETDVDVYMLPFVKASQARHFFPDDDIQTYEDAVRSIISRAPIDKRKINILVAHQFVAGKGMDPALAGSEGAAAQSVGTVEKIGYGCFDDFDYVALGHIHSPQRVGRDEVRYSGSPLKYSLSEADDEKSVPLITAVSGQKIKIELIPLKPKRDMRHITGTLSNLLDKKNVSNPDDYIYATLTDEDAIDDVMGKFRQTYPNAVKIDYDNSRTRSLNEAKIWQMDEKKPFKDLIGDFYEITYGCAMTGEEMDIMMAAAKEAGVVGEAD